MGKRILVVDDDASIAQFNAKLLQLAGHQAESCTDTLSALRQITSDGYEVLVTDLNLGSRADGYILAGALKLARPGATVLLVTGSPDLQQAWKMMQSFVDRVLIKPVNSAAMQTAIEWLHTAGREPHPMLKLADLIERQRMELIEDWLAHAEADAMITTIALDREARLDDLEQILDDIVYHLRRQDSSSHPERLHGAWKHGLLRRRQGYALPALVREASHIRQAITRLISRYFLDLDPENLLNQLFTMNLCVDENLQQSLAAFSANDAGKLK